MNILQDNVLDYQTTVILVCLFVASNWLPFGNICSYLYILDIFASFVEIQYVQIIDPSRITVRCFHY